MKKFILITAIIELLAGVIFLLAPQIVPDLSQNSGPVLSLCRMYGAAAIGLGIVAFQVWRHSDNPQLLKIFFSSFVVFHLAVFVAMIGCFLSGVFKNPGSAVLHLILGIVTAYYFITYNLAGASRTKKILIGLGMGLSTLLLLLGLLPSMLHQAGLHPDYAQSKQYDLQGKKALIITTSHGMLNNPGETTGPATGVFASEMTIPYYEFLDAGMEVDVASIKGGEIPIDPQSFYFMIKSDEDKRYLNDDAFKEKVKSSTPIDEVDFTQYDAVWLAGGWGAAYDLGQSEVLGQKISEAYYAQSPTIGSVCHGALGLIQARDTLGNYLITGRNMTGVTDKQLAELGITATPLHPETELRKLGVNYESQTGHRDMLATHTVIDQERRFVTGQNQNSGHETAQKMMGIIEQKSGQKILD